MVSSFAHQIISEYYGANRYVYIEVIALDQFCALHQSMTLLASGHMSRQAVFQSFLSDDTKKDSITTEAHSKYIIEILQNREIFFTDISTIWENMDGCA